MNKFVSKIVSLIAALSMIAPVGFAPATALAATTIFSDGFGTSELPSSITGWTESGGSTTGSASGPDATRNGVSSNKFARLDDDNSYMYRTIDATGYENLTLKYYYKGDANAGSSDDLHVQFCDGSSCSSFADLSGGVHGLDNCVDIQPGPGVNLLCSWSSEQSRTLPAAADNGLFRIRFLNDSDDGDEHARIDDISIEGDPIAPIEYTLTVSKAGTGTGYVQSDLTSDIDCGSDCSDPFTSGSVVELFQTADPGSVFAGWSGACTGTGSCFVTMNAAKSVTATFNLIPEYTLTVSKNGTGTGYVQSDLTSDIDCGSDCSDPFTEGTLVELFQTADPGSTFAGWSGACTGTGSCFVTMDSAKSVTATFNLSEVEPTTGSLTIVKSVTDESGSFDFHVYTGETDISGSPFSLVASVGSDATSDTLVLEPGTYAVYEDPETGWTLDSATCTDGDNGFGSFEPNSGVYGIELGAGDEITCTFTNSPVVEPTPTVTVTILKYIDEQPASEGEYSDSFMMTSTWTAENLNEGVETSGSYNLDSGNNYAAVTSEMIAGADYSTEEVLNEVVASACIESEVPVPYALVGYTVGNSVAAAEAGVISEDAPVLTDITSNKYIIVWNDNCSTEGGDGGGGDGEDADPAIIWLAKKTLGLGGSFTFDINGDGVSEDDMTTTITTDYDGDQEAEKIYVYPSESDSEYTITENLPGGWKLDGVECEMDGDPYSLSGETLTLQLDPNDSVVCTFTNTAIAELVVIKNVINDDGETMTANQFNIEVANEGDLLPVVGSESGNSLELTPGTYQVVESENPSYNATYSDECSGSIALGEQKTCTITNNDIEREDGTTSGSEADGGDDEGSVLGASVDTESDNGQTGSVLGASCPLPTFEQLITIKNGVGADPEIVKPVQEWLNSTMDAGLTVNGVYDEATRFAVMLFQEKYSDTLAPWGNIKATGNIWLTTAAKMLEVAGCGTVELPELVPFNS